MRRTRTRRRLLAMAIVAILAVVLGGTSPVFGSTPTEQTGGSDSPPASAGAQLTSEEIVELDALFDDNPLLGGQVPPRRHLWVNEDVSIFAQFDNPNPELATSLRYIGIGVKGVFCAEAQPDGPNGAFPHFHRLTAPLYGEGHGGEPGELGYWLLWLAVDEFTLGTRVVKPGIDYDFFPTLAPQCGDDVPEPDFEGPGEGKLTKQEIDELLAIFDDTVFTGRQQVPWASLRVNEEDAIVLQFDTPRAVDGHQVRYFGFAQRGTFCADQQPHTDFTHYRTAHADNWYLGAGGQPGETEGYWTAMVAADSFRSTDGLPHRVSPNVDRQYWPTPPPEC